MPEIQHETIASTAKKDNGVWITDGAWISGLAGVIMVLVMAFVSQQNGWAQHGLSVFGVIELNRKFDVELFCLIVIALTMCVVELARLSLAGHKPIFTIASELKNAQYGILLLKSALRYLSYLALFYAIIFIYKVAPEYGFVQRKDYYYPWFKMCKWLFNAFLWAGFPYILLSYALKYDENKDKNSYHQLVNALFFCLIAVLRLPLKKTLAQKVQVNKAQLKKIALGLLVRVFFMPLMTVFFVEQFGLLVSNMNYMFNSLPHSLANGNYSHATFNQDLINIMKAVIFSIDVALAWCGYVLTSRWLDNETQSTEPTLLGWLVCLISYPPFQLAGLYFLFPSENLINNLGNHYFVTFFSVLTIASFIIYTASTVVFGVRFSNLTHRGIIRRGPFAIVRHPAYTSKNIGWWLGIFPVLLYLYVTDAMPLIQLFLFTIALMAQSYWYYWRALTEERHLSVDPAYSEYCKAVPYRFIPGVL